MPRPLPASSSDAHNIDAGNIDIHKEANAPGAGVTARLVIHPAHDHDEALIAAWERLVGDTAEPNPYAESWYVLPGLQEFDAARKARHYALWIGDDMLAGIITLAPSLRYGRFPLQHMVNWVHANCFLGTPLIRKGWEERFWQAVLDALDADETAHTLFYLSGLVDGGDVHRGLVAACQKSGRNCDIVFSVSRAVIETDLSQDDYWDAAVRGKKRKELRRQAARLAELGHLHFTRLAPSDDVAPWIESFLMMERLGWKGEAGSALGSSEDTHHFFEAVMVAAHARNMLDGLALWLDDKPIAMLFHFISGDGGFSFKTAYDPDYARYSPGVLIQRENLNLLERRNLHWIDSCAAPDHPMINSLWQERRDIIRVAISIGGWKDKFMFTGVRTLERLRAWSKGRKGVS